MELQLAEEIILNYEEIQGIIRKQRQGYIDELVQKKHEHIAQYQ